MTKKWKQHYHEANLDQHSLADIFNLAYRIKPANTKTTTYSALWQDEFFDVGKVIDMGAKKYAPNGWLEPEGHGTSHKEMHASIFRHLAASSAGIDTDKESGLDHLLHVACRALMLYTRRQRNIKHPKD